MFNRKDWWISPENSLIKKVGKHIPSSFSVSTVSSFKNIENKHDVYRGKDCMKKFCEFLREHAMEKIILKKEVTNKLTAEIISKSKNLLDLQRKVWR